MAETLILNDVEISVRRKKIKNLHLAVYPPDGQVRISAPDWMSDDSIRLFAISRLGWIRKNQAKHRGQARETPREYLNQETHMVWGNPYLLRIEKAAKKPEVLLDHSTLILRAASTDKAHLENLLRSWYRQILRQAALPRMEKWRNKLGLPEISLLIRRMKTRWGSCLPGRGRILLNTELAKKPYECLEYVILHELLHFFESNHGRNFKELMDRHMPQWQSVKQRLNSLPLSYGK